MDVKKWSACSSRRCYKNLLRRKKHWMNFNRCETKLSNVAQVQLQLFDKFTELVELLGAVESPLLSQAIVDLLVRIRTSKTADDFSLKAVISALPEKQIKMFAAISSCIYVLRSEVAGFSKEIDSQFLSKISRRFIFGPSFGFGRRKILTKLMQEIIDSPSRFLSTTNSHIYFTSDKYLKRYYNYWFIRVILV